MNQRAKRGGESGRDSGGGQFLPARGEAGRDSGGEKYFWAGQGEVTTGRGGAGFKVNPRIIPAIDFHKINTHVDIQNQF